MPLICQICKATQLQPLVDSGPTPLSNRYNVEPGIPSYLHHLKLVQCQLCATVQIAEPVPDSEIIPRVPWLKYNEPEDHLDDLADRIASLDLPARPCIGALTYKDDSLLTRLAKRLDATIWRLDPETDLGITIPGAGGETVQSHLTPAAAQAIAANHGHMDILVARHMFEHASSTRRFADAIKQLLAPGGTVVLEVPSATNQLTAHDYTMIWEEHNLYLTPTTFPQALAAVGLAPSHVHCYSFSVEDSLVAFAQATKPKAPKAASLSKELALGQSYANAFLQTRQRTQEAIAALHQEHGPLAIFGGGHLTFRFINLMQVAQWFSCILDDNPHKQGLWAPGSNLPIQPSSRLYDNDRPRVVLSSLSPASEAKVVASNQKYLDQGGRFYSIFPTSSRALPLAVGSC